MIINCYEVLFGADVVGTVCVHQIGLYTQFECQCTFSKDDLYRIVAKHKAGQINLGICIQEGDFYVINTKIPTKYIGYNDLKFCALVESEVDDATFVPVTTDARFGYIADIMHAKFCVREGRKGLLLCKD